MKTLPKYSQRQGLGNSSDTTPQRRAVGYIRVSTDMQALEGLSLEAQQAAIESYCALHGIKLVRVCKDIISGGKNQRPGLQEALSTLQRSADILTGLRHPPDKLVIWSGLQPGSAREFERNRVL